MASHGGSTFQKKRLARELVREKKDPSEHVEKSSRADFPLAQGANLPQGVLEAARPIAENESDAVKAIWEGRIEQIKNKAVRCAGAAEK